MSHNYNVSDLTSVDSTQLDWGLAWARFISKDTPVNEVWPQYTISDEEWIALLSLTSIAYNSSLYYFPVEAVVMKILSDPTFAQSVSEDGYSQTFRDPATITTFLRISYGNRLSQYYPSTFLVEYAVPSWSPRF